MHQASVATKTLRWGTYTRISDDALDLKAGVTRQQDDCDEAVAARGGEVIRTFVENDTSAWHKKKVMRTDELGNEHAVWRVIRPVWQSALAALRSGDIDALLVYDLDRLARDPRDLEDAIEVVQYYNKKIEGPRPGQIDLSTFDGITMARLFTIMNNKASADTGRRVARAHLENAREGRLPGGPRPFGWQSDRIHLDVREAGLVRDGVDMLIEGRKLWDVARYWTAQGVTTTKGNAWDQNAVKAYFRPRPNTPAYRLIGLRSYRGEVMVVNDEPVHGIWEPLLDEEKFWAVQGILDHNIKVAKSRQGRPEARKYLLTGLTRCAECTSPMWANTSQQGKKFNYVCRARRAEFGHTFTIQGFLTDDYVMRLLVERLKRGDGPRSVPVEDWEGQAALLEIQDGLKDAMVRMKSKKLSPSRAMAMIEQLEVQEAELLAEFEEWKSRVGGKVPTKVKPEDLEAADVDAKRAVLRQYIRAIYISPSSAGKPRTTRKGIDVDRIQVDWY